MIKNFKQFESNDFIPKSFIQEEINIESFCSVSRNTLNEIHKELKEKFKHIIDYWFDVEKDDIITFQEDNDCYIFIV